MTSARSAGPSRSAWSETLPKLKVSRITVPDDRLVRDHHRLRQEAALGADLDDMAGPTVVGSGTPPSRPSCGQFAGKLGVGTAGTILTSVLARRRSDSRAGAVAVGHLSQQYSAG